MNKFDLVKFTDNDFELDVRADSEHETVWSTQENIAILFEVYSNSYFIDTTIVVWFNKLGNRYALTPSGFIGCFYFCY